MASPIFFLFFLSFSVLSGLFSSAFSRFYTFVRPVPFPCFFFGRRNFRFEESTCPLFACTLWRLVSLPAEEKTKRSHHKVNEFGRLIRRRISYTMSFPYRETMSEGSFSTRVPPKSEHMQVWQVASLCNHSISTCSATYPSSANAFFQHTALPCSPISEKKGFALPFLPQACNPHPLLLYPYCTPTLPSRFYHIHFTYISFRITTFKSIMAPFDLEPIRRALCPKQFPTSNVREAPDGLPASPPAQASNGDKMKGKGKAKDEGPLDLDKLPLKPDNLLNLPEPGHRYLSLDGKKALVNPAQTAKASNATKTVTKAPRKVPKKVPKKATMKAAKKATKTSKATKPASKRTFKTRESPRVANSISANEPKPSSEDTAKPTTNTPTGSSAPERASSNRSRARETILRDARDPSMPSPSLTTAQTSPEDGARVPEAHELSSLEFFAPSWFALSNSDVTLETVRWPSYYIGLPCFPSHSSECAFGRCLYALFFFAMRTFCLGSEHTD